MSFNTIKISPKIFSHLPKTRKTNRKYFT